MNLVSLAITDFRNIEQATFEPDPTGITVITGLNGAGKTSVLEAVSYLSTLQSFRSSRGRPWSAGAPSAPSCGRRPWSTDGP